MSQLGVHPVAVQRAVGLQVRLLHDVVEPALITGEQLVGHASETRVMATQQLGEGVAVSAEHPLDEAGVTVRRRAHRSHGYTLVTGRPPPPRRTGSEDVVMPL